MDSNLKSPDIFGNNINNECNYSPFNITLLVDLTSVRITA